MKKYQTLVSRRYLRSRVVNLLAVLAITLGVTALILVSSVMSGFARDIQQRIRGVLSDIVVDSVDPLAGIGDYERLVRRIERVPNVAAAAPLVECPFVLIRIANETQRAYVRGVDLERERRTTAIDSYVRRVYDDAREAEREQLLPTPYGAPRRPRSIHEHNKAAIDSWLGKKNLDFRYDNGMEPGHPGLLVGAELAIRLRGLQPGVEVVITSPTTILTFQSLPFSVVGAFRCGHYEYDNQLVYVPLQAAQTLTGLPGRVTSIDVKLHDLSRANETKREIESAIRNATPLINPDDPADLARMSAAGGSFKVEKDKDARWLRVAPDGQDKPAEVIIRDLAPILEQADRPTTLSFRLRWPKSEAKTPTPAFGIALIDSAGRRYRADPQAKLWFPDASASTWGYRRPCELANFTSEDGLDLLDPADVAQLVLTVHNAPVDFADIRFEDNRNVQVSTWRDKRANLLQAVEIERTIQVIIMGLIVIVAGFGIMAILWLMIKEKTRDIGILMAVGATRGGIVRIFLLNGLLIGAVGAALGLAVGWTVSVNLNLIEDKIFAWTGWRAFPPDIYYLDRLPHQENPTQFVAFALMALVVSLTAALWPAIKASQLDPVEALRYE